ncbi:hypothetical protein [Thiolinea disciformis]|uniref:hypothetical protein n=1 Tax=Thiolinea disciformis TaxID=125614 RepID=UPI00037FC8C7|nr:hypothetical protein [Thiolinea disciformis]
MKQLTNKILLCLGLWLPCLVWADQCELISAEQTSEMLEFMKPNIEYVNFCEPCGDKDFYQQKVERLRSLQINTEKVGGKTYWAVKVNGKNIDLAYTFIRSEDGGFVNLANLANCPATGVSLGFDPSK